MFVCFFSELVNQIGFAEINQSTERFLGKSWSIVSGKETKVVTKISHTEHFIFTFSDT